MAALAKTPLLEPVGLCWFFSALVAATISKQEAGAVCPGFLFCFSWVWVWFGFGVGKVWILGKRDAFRG